MDDKETILTPEGLRKLEDELGFLKSVKRKEVAERIKQSKEFGDLMENSEYEDAKNEQAFVEGRILTLEGMLRNAKVIDNHDVRSDVVTVAPRRFPRSARPTGDSLLILSWSGSASGDPTIVYVNSTPASSWRRTVLPTVTTSERTSWLLSLIHI